MKECLHCGEQYEAKRESSKFCSTSCRVMHNRKSQKKKSATIQENLTELLAEVRKIVRYDGPKLPDNFTGDEYRPDQKKLPEISYNDATSGLLAATSSAEIEIIWRRVLLKKDWPGWQMRELTKIKENQRTKIDF